MSTPSSIPDKFLGQFKHERSENFDEYLTSKGVPWVIRKMICYIPVTKVLEKSSVNQGCYNFYNHSMKENTAFENWALGESFQSKGLDGKQHQITFNMEDPDTLTEKHYRLENPGDQARNSEVYKYTIEGDKLVLKLENETTVCRRYFRRIPDQEESRGARKDPAEK